MNGLSNSFILLIKIVALILLKITLAHRSEVCREVMYEQTIVDIFVII